MSPDIPMFWSVVRPTFSSAMLALKNEARRRVESGCFFGSIAYGSLVAQKPLLFFS